MQASRSDLLMRARLGPVALAVLSWLCCGGSLARAQEQIIFDNGQPLSSGEGIASDFDFPGQVADDFILFADQSIVTRIDWWGVYASSDTPTAPDDFTIRIFADTGLGEPVATPFYQRRVGHVGRTVIFTGGASDVYAYSVSVPPIVLPADVTLWLSIVNDTTADTDDSWFWSRSDLTVENLYVRITDQGDWFFIPAGKTSFQLFIPEPASAMLACSAMLMLLAQRRPRSACSSRDVVPVTCGDAQ
jgi:hypothetical protein